MMKIKVKVMGHAADLNLPKYETDGASGMDVVAANKDNILVRPRERALIPTGLCFSIPNGYEIQIRSRSGLTLKNGLCVANGPATIDSDFSGEVCVILINHGNEAFLVKRGMRIAQIVLQKIEYIDWEEVYELEKTERGDGGFGSTGV